MSKIVGIDLGTTFSAIAHVNDNGVPELIPNEEGKSLTPSVIFYDDGEFVVGEYAKQNAVAEPENIVEFIKREMGKPITEFSRVFGGKEYSPEELSAEILKTLKKDAESKLAEQITDAIITVPAYFNDPERQATIRAGKIAGFNVQRIINEPTAAALSYGMHYSGDTATVLVFDLGGGTFDVTVMEVTGEEMKILATNGDHRLGGKDWDDKIILHVAKRFESEHGENPLTDLATYLEIQTRAIDAKIQLSTLNRATIITNYAGKSHQLQLTRQEYEEMTTDLVERCRSLVEVVLYEVELTADQVDTVLLVGGSTRLPMIQNMLTEHFGNPPDTSVNPDEAVVFGAAVMGELIQSEEPKKSAFLGAAPKTPKQNFGIMRISDVCSHSLGMVTLDNIGELYNSIIIPKNTNIPCEISKDYDTISDNQTEFDVIVLQGGEELAPRECPVRDAYEVFDIPPRPAGDTRIKVTFKYNANGVIEVEAEDADNKKILPIRKKEGDIDWEMYETPEAVAMPMDIALAIDCSGSMGGGSLDDAKAAASQFLYEIDVNSHVSLISFGGSQIEVEMNLTQDFDQLRQAIERLKTRGTTPMTEAIELARNKVMVNSQNTNVLIILTDGYPDNTSTTLKEAERAKREGIQIVTIGVGDGVDSDYLKQVASTPEDYYFVEESVQLEAAFTTIASRLVTESSGRTAGITRH
ncbi:MAG: Hsp70 family protein [Candidatus Poribacteria bacterium]|nr:Hsp70 family protein [Candidatus Poribacteria bacterium]